MGRESPVGTQGPQFNSLQGGHQLDSTILKAPLRTNEEMPAKIIYTTTLLEEHTC